MEPATEAEAIARMTIFERCNYLAEKSKARKWEEHNEWVKDNGPIEIGNGDVEIDTMTTFAVGSSEGTRSTHGGPEMFATAILVMRITEILAFLHMLGVWWYDDELTIVRAEKPGPKMRACIGCIMWHKVNIHHPERDFVKNKRRLHGLGYNCPSCRQRISDRVYYPGREKQVA